MLKCAEVMPYCLYKGALRYSIKRDVYMTLTTVRATGERGVEFLMLFSILTVVSTIFVGTNVMIIFVRNALFS